MPIKFLPLGGGGGFWVFLKGGVEVPILFLWAWGFFRDSQKNNSHKRLQASPEQLHGGTADYKRGLFTWGISRISKSQKFSRKWSDSRLFSRVWGSSRISKVSRISRKWTFLKRPLLQKTPFQNPSFDTSRTRKFTRRLNKIRVSTPY